VLKHRSGHYIALGIILVLCLSFNQTKAFGYEINDKFSIGGILAGAYQYELLNQGDDDGGGAVPFQPEMSFRPTDNDEFFAKFGFAAGNGLNNKTPFILAPWGADLEDDVKNINGRNRDYLLTAWYKHTFRFKESLSLELTGGIIDGTDYLGANVYANDEYTQFMNKALVNAANNYIPSYDMGGAAELNLGNFDLKGVFMSVGENDDGNSFQFYGGQLTYKVKTSRGKGHYRMLVEFSSKDFVDTAGEDEKHRAVLIFSFDQELGEIFGGWIRFGFQDDAAAIDAQNFYSGGINISGKPWDREDDNIGLGYAYLNGGNLETDNGQVAELYARFVLNDYFAITPDVQYLRQKSKDDEVIEGFIFGIRLVAEF
jgi:hypothetical protein